MPLFRRSNDIGEKIHAVIGADFTVTGTINGQGSLRVDGTVEGDLIVNGNVIIGEKAQVTGNITAYNVLVAGTVSGNITAQGRLEITAHGCVMGDTTSATLVVDEGGILSGQSRMTAESR